MTPGDVVTFVGINTQVRKPDKRYRVGYRMVDASPKVPLRFVITATEPSASDSLTKRDTK